MWRSSPPRSLGATTHLKKKTTTRLSRSPPASSASAPIRAVSHESPLLVGPRQLVGLDQPEGGERVQCRGFHCEQCRGGIQQPSDQQDEEWEHDDEYRQHAVGQAIPSTPTVAAEGTECLEPVEYNRQ